MSTHEIFAAFIVNHLAEGPGRGLDRDPLEWVCDRAGRAGLAPRVASDSMDQDVDDLPYGDALPYMEGDWLGLPVELRFVDGEDFRALVVVVGHSAFMRRIVRSGDVFLESVVSAFRDACDAIAPRYAYVVTAPEDDIPGHLKQVSVDLHGVDPQALTGLGLPMVYLDAAFTTDLQPVDPSLRVPSERGVVLVAGETLTGWL